ncbi:MAG: hypothetical protein PHE68_03530 [Candidatus Peribacteraceae bacterium]|nr:hypothetical protein [Candidatus Peribacteraceae bacterium]MDD5075416.1 hypothetical protein [Candidatus Peribacteraceae bacterium]
MTLLWIPVGMILPALSGWFLLRILENRTPVLLRLERWVLGFLLGLTGTMELTFLARWAGLITLNRWGFLSVQLILTALLAIAFIIGRLLSPSNLNLTPTPKALRPTPFILKILLVLALLWTVVKLAMGSFILVTTPPFYDDTVKNWNLRGKIFYLTGNIPLSLNTQDPKATDPLSSYPPTVPLVKASLASLAGRWDEGIVNGIHALWFFALIALLYAALRRQSSRLFGLWGIVVFVSLPFALFQGVNAYADIFVAAHLFAAVHLLFLAAREQDNARRDTFLRLFALATALLTFTKNEALILHLPVLLALFAGLLVLRFRKRHMTAGMCVRAVAWMGGFLLVLLLPWLCYKWGNALTFGNAKSIGGTFAGWQPYVLSTLWANTFFEGNWHLLFPLLFALVLCRWKALRSPLLIPAGFLFVSLAMQIGLFLFTSLSAEATMQTGFARGVVQLSPVAVFLLMLFLHGIFVDPKDSAIGQN